MMPNILRQSAAPAWLLLAMLAACAEYEMPTDLQGSAPVLGPPTGSTTFTGNLRLGVVEGASSLQVSGTDAFVIRDRVTGATLMTGVGETATVSYVDQSIPGKTSFRLLTKPCVTLEERDAYVELARLKEEQQARGFVTYYVETGTCWKVYLGDLPLSSASSTRSAFRTLATQQGLAKSTDPFERVTTVASLKGFRIVKGTTSITSPNYILIEPVTGTVSVNGTTVDGNIEIFRNAAGSLTAVNELPLERYLRRVLPMVLPPASYNVAEAQKAHAIAERTRALYNHGRRAARGFDFYPGEFQPYGGPEVEHEISTAAIDATAGMVATVDGQLIDTPYHPVSGGWTANSEDVFEPVVPYLRGISELDLPWGLEKKLTLEGFSRSGSTDLRQEPKQGRGVWKRFSYWTVDWTKAELATVLGTTFNVPVANVTAVRVVERGTYGRVRRIEFDTDAGTLVAEKHDIRSRLPYITLEGGYEPLSSTLFFVLPIQSDGQVTGWRLYGAGLGHGVGMSQLGAVMLGESGVGYDAILTRYYTGATIEQR